MKVSENEDDRFSHSITLFCVCMHININSIGNLLTFNGTTFDPKNSSFEYIRNTDTNTTEFAINKSDLNFLQNVISMSFSSIEDNNVVFVLPEEDSTSEQNMLEYQLKFPVNNPLPPSNLIKVDGNPSDWDENG